MKSYENTISANTSSRKICIQATSALLVVVTVAFLLLMAKAYFDGKFTSVEALQNYISGFGSAGPIMLVLFQALQVIIPILPGALGCAVGSILFGPTVGFLCNYIGISIGSFLAFLLARKFGQALIWDLFPENKYGKWSDWASKSKSYSAFLFTAMLLPMFPDDFLCYLTGVTKMEAKKFLIIIILGKPWCLLAYCLGFSLIK